MSWFAYIVLCEDGFLYVGASTDPKRRLAQHKSGKGAKFFRMHPAQELFWQSGPLPKGEALREEYRLKQLSRSEKLKLKTK